MSEQDTNYIEAVRLKVENASLKAQLQVKHKCVRLMLDPGEPDPPCPYSDDREQTFSEALRGWRPW